MIDRAGTIRDTVDLRTYIERYGQFNHANKMNCPLPGHEDKTPSFVLMDTEQWKCFGCDKSGSVIDFVMEMDGISFKDAMTKLDGKVSSNGNSSNGHIDMSTAPKDIKQASPGNTYTGMADYEQHKYKSSGVFEKWGCKDVVKNGKSYMAMPSTDTIDRLRNLSGKGAKYMPDWENPLAIENKKRHEQKKKNGEPLLPDDHIQAQWFGLAEAQARAIAEGLGKQLILCNGQTSTMIAHEHGLPAFCKTDGENIIPQWLLPELISLLSDGWQLYVALDCDNDGKGHSVAVKIITQLHQYRPMFVDFMSSNGFDLADFCIKHKDKSWAKLQGCIAGLPGSISEQSITDINNGLQAIAKAQRNKQKSTVIDLISDIESRIEVLRAEHIPQEKTVNPVRTAYQKYIEAYKNPKWITGLTCGIHPLNYRLGGFQDDAVYTWIGETGSGKTTLSVSVGAEFMMQDIPGFMVIGEAGENQIINRLVGHIAQVPWASLSKGKIRITTPGKPDRFTPFTSEQDKRIHDAYQDVIRWQKNGILNLRDDNKPLTTASMKSQLRKAVDDNGVRWAIMESNDNIPTAGASSEYERITEAMNAFEMMATTHHIPVFTSSQGGRNTKGRSDKKLKLQDGLGSNHVEGKSYALMTIYNHWHLVKNEEVTEQDNDYLLYPKGTARIYIRKLRDDESGGYITAKFVGGAGWYNH